MRGRTSHEDLARALALNPSLRLKRPPAASREKTATPLPSGATALGQPQARAARRDYKSELLQQFELCGIPAPVLEFCFHPKRKWRWDFCWPERMVAVEYQGGIYGQKKTGHQTVGGMERDCLKFSEGAALGYRVLPINARMVVDGTALDLIEKALAYRAQ